MAFVKEMMILLSNVKVKISMTMIMQVTVHWAKILSIFIVANHPGMSGTLLDFLMLSRKGPGWPSLHVNCPGILSLLAICHANSAVLSTLSRIFYRYKPHPIYILQAQNVTAPVHKRVWFLWVWCLVPEIFLVRLATMCVLHVCMKWDKSCTFNFPAKDRDSIS